MWVNEATHWNYVTTGLLDVDFDSHNQALYLDRNISVDNDKLILETKEENITVGWWNHKYFPWQYLPDNVTPTPQKTIPYTSARAQSRWAFDGDFTIDQGVVSDDEGGIVVEAKLKYPTVDGTFPAFWMMGYYVGEYDEFDIFEFFDNEFDKMSVSLYKTGSDVREFRCLEDFKVEKLQDKFCFYYFIWNRHHIAVYVSLDNKKFDKLYMRHQFARNNRVGSFRCQKEIDENEWYRRRKQYCTNPMRINFNTAVHPPNKSTISENLSAKYEVEYVKVYKQIKCPVESVTTYNEISDFMLRDGVYNVVTAKKAIIDFPVQNMPHLGSGECVKIICEEHVEVNQLRVDPMGEFRIEHVDNVCESDFTPPSETSIPLIETEMDVPYYVYNKQWQITNESEFSTLNKEQIQVVLYDIGGRKIQSFNLYEWENIGELSDRYKSGTYVLVMSNSILVGKSHN